MLILSQWYFSMYLCFTFPKALCKDSSPIEPGLLWAETVNWKSVQPGNLVLKIHTYATKAAMIHLPSGYEVVLFFHIMNY